jgi:hypothetical protein
MARDNKSRLAPVTRISDRPKRSAPTTQSGWLVAWSSTEGGLVDFAGNPHGPLRAARTIALDEKSARQAIATRQELVLSFTVGRPDRPIIVGIVQAEGCLGTVAADRLVDVKIDGKSFIVEAKARIEFRCGKASLILTQDGKILARGAHISSSSSGVNRVRGGTVEIN